MVVRNNYYWLGEESKAGFIANGDIVEVLRIKEKIERYGFRFARATIKMIDYSKEKELDVILLLDTFLLFFQNFFAVFDNFFLYSL